MNDTLFLLLCVVAGAALVLLVIEMRNRARSRRSARLAIKRLREDKDARHNRSN